MHPTGLSLATADITQTSEYLNPINSSYIKKNKMKPPQ